MEQTFSTPYIFLAAFLTVRGYELLQVATKGRRGVFVFARKPELDADLAAFSGDGMVSVAQFVSGVGYLKRELHTAFDSEDGRDLRAGKQPTRGA